MKNRIVATCMLFVIGIIFLTSCEKSVGTNVNTSASVPTPALISGDPAFVGLFDALNHFDPHYLQLVYKDQRTTEEIVSTSKDLFEKLKMNPTSLELLKQLASFYKFNSVTELKYYSDQILVNREIVKNKYFSTNNQVIDQQAQNFINARSNYAKNKKDSIQNNTERIKTSSMYDDYVLNPQAPAFQFFGEMDLEGLNDGGGCNDPCCLKLQICKRDASKNYQVALYNNIITGSVGGITIGTVAGSAIPIIGTTVGAIGGGLYTALLGMNLAINTYQIDLGTCLIAYDLCLRSNKK